MTEPGKNGSLIPISIEEEMQRSYLDYAMSVIVSRAIPDVTDGLKPVQRRILYAMHESGCDYNKPYRKSARIVGEVMGKYHPHGDSAIYDALVRMAQDFSLRVPLIDGQGNFGSMDGDPPAAMRYTESRLEEVAHTMLTDIDKETVDFQENYDGSEKEPVILPAQFPNLLVNGAGGIAVGMATNIPPHNLGEVVDATCALIDNPEITLEELMQIVPAPDFPTGGIILGRLGARSGLSTGRGSVIMRGKTEVEEIAKGKQALIITEVPYQVNKAKLVERIAELVREKKIEGISDLRDESDKSGVRVVIEIRKDNFPEIVLNQLYSFTPLQTSFGVNMLALHQGRPELMNLRRVLEAFIAFRETIITKRINFLLSKARDRAHILIGLAIAVGNIDEVITLIKSAADPAEAREKLLAKDWLAGDIQTLIDLVDDSQNVISAGKCRLTDSQVRAILEMKLSRLTGLEREKIDNELKELGVEITNYLSILGAKEKVMKIMRDELLAIKEKFGTPRLTQIEDSEFEHDIEDLIQKEDMVVTVTMGGYIKRVPLSTYRAQRRGGKGRAALSMNEEDITTDVFISNTHTPVLFFSNLGKVYKLKVYKLPLGNPQAKGRALVNIFPLAPDEKITVVMPLPEDETTWDNLHIMFATAKGNVRRNDLSDFKSIQSNGKIAIRLEDNDKLIGVMTCDDKNHILLAAKEGNALRFPVEKVRVFKSRTSDGVRGMRLTENDRVISMSVLKSAEIEMAKRELFLKIPVEARMEIAKLEEEAGILAKLGVAGIPEGLTPAEIYSLAKNEEFILTVAENGYGKRTSAYEYRITNRGGSGVTNILTSERNGKVVGSFPVKEKDQIMLITNKGKLIRCPVHDIRVAGRSTQGVTIFKTGDGESVVSAAHIAEGENGDGGIEEQDTPELHNSEEQ